jgi:hypothetical protein
MALELLTELIPVLRFAGDLFQPLRRANLKVRIYTSKKDYDGRLAQWGLVFEAINIGKEAVVIVDWNLVVEKQSIAFERLNGNPEQVLPYNLKPGEVWSGWMPAHQAGTQLLGMGLSEKSRPKLRVIDARERKYYSKPLNMPLAELAQYPNLTY